MPRHAKDQAKNDSKEAKLRHEAIEKLRPLTPKWIKHIETSLESVVPCEYCTKEGLAAKVDVNGKCLKCHGEQLVPDKSQRNWAAEEVGARLAPKPKAQEIQLDDKREFDELAEKLKNIDDTSMDQLASSLGIVFDDDTAGSSQDI